MLESTCFLTVSSMGCVIIFLIFTNLRVEKWHLSIIFTGIYLIMGEYELFFSMFKWHLCIFTCKFELLVHNFSDFFGVLVFYFSDSQNSLYMKDVLRPLFVAYVANIYCQFISCLCFAYGVLSHEMCVCVHVYVWSKLPTFFFYWL